MPEALITSRDTKGLHAVGIFEAAYNQAGLNDARAQRLNENGGEFKKGLAALIQELSATNRYKDQVVKSSYTYPPEYKGPKDFHEQCEILLGILPGLDPEPAWKYYTDCFTALDLPEWIEGAFAVPSESAMARLFYPEVQGRAEQYCSGLNLLMDKIADSRKFYNYRDGRIDPAHLWRTERTTEMLNRLFEMQGGSDIIVLPAQLGMRHRGLSALRVRECFIGSEFGAGSLETLAIALTHPERFVRWEQLHEDIPGDYFSFEADGQADEAPCLHFYDDEFKFSTDDADLPDESYGSVSCWLPPQ